MQPPSESSISARVQRWSTNTLTLVWQQPWLKVTLNRPERRNALSRELIDHWCELLKFIETNPSIRALVVSGGRNMFCSGADLKEIESLSRSAPNEVKINNHHFGNLLHLLHLCRVPVICLVDGPALGGGLGLVCAADLVFATKQSRFGMPETKLGLLPAQILPYVVRKLGLSKAQSFALQGLDLTGQQAAHHGLVTKLCDDYSALESACNEALTAIGRCGPVAVARTKQMLNDLNRIESGAIAGLAEQVQQATQSPEGKAGRAAFANRCTPPWVVGPKGNEV